MQIGFMMHLPMNFGLDLMVPLLILIYYSDLPWPLEKVLLGETETWITDDNAVVKKEEVSFSLFLLKFERIE
jgi:hypothetical protein